MKWIIASDYDGTLRQNGAISPRTVCAIEKFRKAGHLFGLVTGRDYVSFREMQEREIPFDLDFAILSGGAVCCDGRGEILFSSSVRGDTPWGDTTLVHAFVDRCFRMTGEACGLVIGKTRLNFHPELPEGGPYPGHETVYDPFSAIDDVKEFILGNGHIFAEEDAAVVVEKLRAEFGAFLNPTRNGSFIDVPPAGVDKATGLARYAKAVCVSPENIWTVGDNHNDLPMLKAFHGCAIADRPAAESGEAEFVVGEVADVVEMLLKKA